MLVTYAQPWLLLRLRSKPFAEIRQKGFLVRRATTSECAPAKVGPTQKDLKVETGVDLSCYAFVKAIEHHPVSISAANMHASTSEHPLWLDIVSGLSKAINRVVGGCCLDCEYSWGRMPRQA